MILAAKSINILSLPKLREVFFDKFGLLPQFTHDNTLIYTDRLYNIAIKLGNYTYYMQSVICKSNMEHIIIPVNSFANNELIDSLIMHNDYEFNHEYTLSQKEFDDLYDKLNKSTPCCLINLQKNKKIIQYFIVKDVEKYIYMCLNANNNTVTYLPYTTIKEAELNLNMNTHDIYDKLGHPLYTLNVNNNTNIHIYSFSIPYDSHVLEINKEKKNKKNEDDRTVLHEQYSQYYIYLTIKNDKLINIYIKYLLPIALQ